MKNTHYDTLNVSHDAPQEIINAAYKALMKGHQSGQNASGAHTMKTIDEAYEVLSDPVKRKSYDDFLGRQEQQPEQSDETWQAPWEQRPVQATQQLETEVREPWLRRAAAALGRWMADIFSFIIRTLGFSIKAILLAGLMLGCAYILFRFVVAKTCYVYKSPGSWEKGMALCQYSEGASDILYYVLGSLILIVLMAHSNMKSK